MKLHSPLAALGLFQLMATVQYCTMAVLLIGIPCWFLSLHIKRKRQKRLVAAGAPAPAPPSRVRKYTQIAVTIAAWAVWGLLLAVFLWFRLGPHRRPIL